jgi:hypothetical protein
MPKVLGAVRWFAAIQTQYTSVDSLRWELTAKDRETASVVVLTHTKFKWLPSDVGVVYAPSDLAKWYGRDCWSYRPYWTDQLKATANFETESYPAGNFRYCEGFIKIGALPLALVYTNNKGRKMATEVADGLPVIHYKTVHKFLMGRSA